MDLETLTIVRGRDAGLATYNNARLAYGLRPISNFSDLNPDLPAEVYCLLMPSKILNLKDKNEV